MLNHVLAPIEKELYLFSEYGSNFWNRCNLNFKHWTSFNFSKCSSINIYTGVQNDRNNLFYCFLLLQPELFLWCSISVVLLMNFLKIYIIISLSTIKFCQNKNKKKKKSKIVCNELFIQVSWSYVYFFKSYKCTTEKNK